MASSLEVFNAGELKTEILKALDQTETPGSFACRGKVTWAINPGLDINGLGLVGLPLSTREAEAIIEKCRKSPFGKGDKTLVDDSLYKLLIYEPGAFFKPHQDSEKTPGMFGTLIVSLPSQHQGGRVVLSHNKQKVEFDSSAYTPFGTTYGAWYSDVFHEVEKASIAQKAPDPDSKARMRRVLEAWEHASIEESLFLDMLRREDLTKVLSLNDACQEAGWNIYLATHEKTLDGDEEWDLTDFSRQDEYKHLVKLDGTNTALNPDYDRSCYLIDEESSDEDADESEHEGYTGNEGAPTTFWYRKAVALLVPPSRVFEFGLTPEQKNRAVLQKLEELVPQAHTNLAVKMQMYSLCNLVLEAEKISGVWPSYSRRGKSDTPNQSSCEKEIAKIALDQDWLDIFDRVPVTQKIGSEVIETLGRYLREKGLGKARKSINEILQKLASISAKHSMLQDITKAFKSGDQSRIDQKFKNEFDKWYSYAIKDILNTKERASADDGAALAKVAKASTIDISAPVLLKLDAAPTRTVAAFVIEFAKDNPDLTSTLQRRYLEATLDKLWSDFSYFESITESQQWPYMNDRTRIETIDFNSLGPLLTITKKYCNKSNKDQDSEENRNKSAFSLPSALRVLSDATRGAPETFLRNDLMAFVLQIVSHKIPAVIIDGADADNDDDDDLFDALSHFITIVITRVIRQQGLEPMKPKDWSLPAKSCGCQHCKVIAEFMRNALRRDIAYPTNKQNRRHLDDMYYVYGTETADYTISVNTDLGSPHRWTCHKEHFSYQKKHKEWKSKRDYTRGRLEEMDRGERAVTRKANKKKNKKGSSDNGGGVLRNWLGEHYGVIMECRVEKLPSTEEEEEEEEDRKEEEKRPMHGSRKALATLDQANTNERLSSRKRGADDEEGPENVKKARLAPEVIDLT